MRTCTTSCLEDHQCTCLQAHVRPSLTSVSCTHWSCSHLVCVLNDDRAGQVLCVKTTPLLPGCTVSTNEGACVASDVTHVQLT
jgi:hypothetical protein